MTTHAHPHIAASLFCAAFLAVAANSLPSTAEARPSISWTTHTSSCLVNPGDETTFTAQMQAPGVRGDVSVFVTPEIAGNVTVEPRSLRLDGSTAVREFTVTCHAEAEEPLGGIDGTIHVRMRNRTLARPLPVTVHVVPQGRTLPYFVSPEPTAVVVDPEGGIYPVNQLGVALAPEATEADARRIAESVGGELLGYIPSGNMYQMEIPAQTISDLTYWREKIEIEPLVDFTILNMASTLVSQPSSDLDTVSSFAFSDDVYDISRSATWAYDDIRVREAFRVAAQAGKLPQRPVPVGVVDSGIDISHPEFIGVKISTKQETDVGSATCRSTPAATHGTDVAGIIGANNWVGQGKIWRFPEMNGILTGLSNLDYRLIAPKQKGIEGLTIEPTFGFTRWDLDISFYLSLLQRMQVAIDEGAKIVNVSMGATRCGALPPNQCEDNAGVSCDYYQCLLDLGACIKDTEFFDQIRAYDRLFSDNRDVLFVVSAGNNGEDVADSLPAGINSWRSAGRPHSNVLSVAASALRPFVGERPDGPVQWMDFSNYGAGIDIAAPGQGIWAPTKYLAPISESDYRFFLGTSGAAPLVTGVAGVMMALSEDEISPADVKRILQETASGGPCRDPSHPDGKGGCLLNAEAAIQEVLKPKPTNPCFTNLRRTLVRAEQILSNDFNGEERTERFTNITSEPFTVGRVFALYLDPADIGLSKLDSNDLQAAIDRASSLYPEYGFWGLRWVDSPPPQTVRWTNSGLIWRGPIVLGAGQSFEVTHTAKNDLEPDCILIEEGEYAGEYSCFIEEAFSEIVIGLVVTGCDGVTSGVGSAP